MNVKKIYKEKLEENEIVHPGKILSTVLLKYNIMKTIKVFYRII